MGEPLRTAAGRDADRAGERVDDRGDTFDRTQLELERACEPFMDQVGESRRQRASVPRFEVGEHPGGTDPDIAVAHLVGSGRKARPRQAFGGDATGDPTGRAPWRERVSQDAYVSVVAVHV